MRSVIFSFIPCSEASMVASTRVARFVSETLGLPLIWDESIAEHRDLEALLIVNGAFGYCKYLEQLSHAILGAKRIVWIQNDYTIVRPINDGKAESPFRRAFVQRREEGKPHLEFWTTCERESRATPLSCYVNWNCLPMREPVRRGAVQGDVAYYGSFRTNRRKSFDDYFGSPRCRIIISSPSKKFQELYASQMIKHVPQQSDLIGWLSQRGVGLFLEDDKSHREYHSPPNRFYEMLSAGLPMVFQMQAGPTMRKAGYNPSDYIAETPAYVARLLGNRERVGREQRERWLEKAMTERETLPKVVRSAWSKLRERS